jgi:hypothetical protein
MVLAGFKPLSTISETEKQGLGQLTDSSRIFHTIAPITMEPKVLDMEWTESEAMEY